MHVPSSRNNLHFPLSISPQSHAFPKKKKGQIEKRAPIEINNRPFILTFSEFKCEASLDFPIFPKNKPPNTFRINREKKDGS